MSGIVSLYYKGQIIRSASYASPYDRKQITAKWGAELGQKYKECFLQIYPHPQAGEMVRPDGTNYYRNKTAARVTGT